MNIFLSEPGKHFKGRKKRITELFQHRTDRFKKVQLFVTHEFGSISDEMIVDVDCDG